jgi:glycosyltransferase involved in cell wall biosynthesis
MMNIPRRQAVPTLAFVIPCYNEEEVIRETAGLLKKKLSRLISEGVVTQDSTINFVDDGSSDSTWGIIEELAKEHVFHGLKLSRNQGHQNALLAGLLNVEGDVIISLDADLQDDIDAVEKMLEEYSNGAEIVYGVRAGRQRDTKFKRLSAEGYYRLLNALGVNLVFNHADYRLMTKRTLDALSEFDEVNLFLRGIIPSLGFRTAIVEYDRLERFAGESKYALSKMLKLAWDGVTSFSNAPLRVITVLGFATSFISICLICWTLAVRLFTERAIPGWASTVIPLVFLGGVQLLSLGVIGEYIAKIYLETKRRPKYLIDKRV